MSWSTFVVALLLGGTTYSLIRVRNRRGKRFLPSPPAWPILGHMLMLGKHPAKKFMEWQKEYGDIYSIKLGVKNVVGRWSAHSRDYSKVNVHQFISSSTLLFR